MLEEIYNSNRQLLWGIGYRMTGNAAEADDIVQETFVRAIEEANSTAHQEWRPWLIRVAINLSQDYLRKRSRNYVGVWLPSPIPTDKQSHPEFVELISATKECSAIARYELLESVSVAFLLAMEALSPMQRAVLLFRDVFDYSTAETADLLQISEQNVKVTLHRARRIMDNYDKARVVPELAREQLTRQALEQFLGYLQSRDINGLEQLLTQDVVAISDGGGEVTALLSPMQGRDNVLRLVTRLYQVYTQSIKISFIYLNGLPAILVAQSKVRDGHASRFTLQCQITASGQISQLHYVLAPGKLTALA